MPDYELVAVARTPQESGPPTLTEVGPIVAPKITWLRDLSGNGSVAFSCQPDKLADDIKLRLRDPLSHPTEVVVYRDGVARMSGFVAGHQLQGEGRQTLSVTCPGLLGYLAYMWVTSDLTFDQIDQTLIGKALVDHWQDQTWGDYGIDTSAITASGVLRDRTYVAREQHQIDRRLRELGAVDGGFDIDIDPATRELILAYPSLGSDLSATVILDGRNVTDPGVVMSVAPGDIASEAFGTGGDGQTAITSIAENTTLRETWGRAGVSKSFDGVTEQATLDDHTATMLNGRAAALLTPGPGLMPVADANVEDFDIGDTVTYEYDAGLGIQSGAFRVASRQVSIDEDGVETMAVSFA
jgi:hypothetical protein